MMNQMTKATEAGSKELDAGTAQNDTVFRKQLLETSFSVTWFETRLLLSTLYR